MRSSGLASCSKAFLLATPSRTLSAAVRTFFLVFLLFLELFRTVNIIIGRAQTAEVLTDAELGWRVDQV